jgi:hypothetical protein
VDRGEGSVFSARLPRVDVIGLDIVVVVVYCWCGRRGWGSWDDR